MTVSLPFIVPAATSSALPSVEVDYVSSNSNNTSQTVHTFTSQSLGTHVSGDEVFVVAGGASAGLSNNATISTLTVSGSSATEVVESNINGTNDPSISIWRISGITGSTGNIVLTFTAETFGAGIFVYRVRNAGTAVTAETTSTTATTTTSINVPARGAVIMGAFATASNLSSANYVFTGSTVNATQPTVGNVARKIGTGALEYASASTSQTIQSVISGSSSYQHVLAAVALPPV